MRGGGCEKARKQLYDKLSLQTPRRSNWILIPGSVSKFDGLPLITDEPHNPPAPSGHPFAFQARVYCAKFHLHAALVDACRCVPVLFSRFSHFSGVEGLALKYICCVKSSGVQEFFTFFSFRKNSSLGFHI